MKLTLVRHTRLQVDSGICYGQTDIDVSEHFEQESSQLNTKLGSQSFDAIYASPLQRCVKLAHALDKGEVTYDHRLKKLHFGDWEMQAWDDLPRDYFDEWTQNYSHMAPPNGETFGELQARGVGFIQEAHGKHQNQHLLLITHGGMIRALLAHVLNMPLKGLFRFDVDYASITQLDFSHDIPKINFLNR